MSFGTSVERFLTTLHLDVALPTGFEVMNPYYDEEVRSVVQQFCRTFYADTKPRLGVWGINPGRFGAGITGLPFTDPYAVRHQLGIDTTLDGRREASAEFIGQVIDAYGGPAAFYADVYLSALCPLGFIKNGKNINFYDDAQLKRDIVPFVHATLQTMVEAGLRTDALVLLGSGALRSFYDTYVRSSFPFDRVVSLDHPRFIMQYRRTSVVEYIDTYISALRG